MASRPNYKEIDARLGARFEHLRKERGLRQFDVAKSVGASQAVVSKVESGVRSLRVWELLAYADAFDMELEQLTAIVLEEGNATRGSA